MVPEPGEDIRRDQRRCNVDKQKAPERDPDAPAMKKQGSRKPGSWRQMRLFVAEPLVEALQSCDLLVSNRAREETAGLEADSSPHGERDAVPDDDASVADHQSHPDVGLSHAREHASCQQADVLWYRVSSGVEISEMNTPQPVFGEEVQAVPRGWFSSQGTRLRVSGK